MSKKNTGRCELLESIVASNGIFLVTLLLSGLWTGEQAHMKPQ